MTIEQASKTAIEIKCLVLVRGRMKADQSDIDEFVMGQNAYFER